MVSFAAFVLQPQFYKFLNSLFIIKNVKAQRSRNNPINTDV